MVFTVIIESELSVRVGGIVLEGHVTTVESLGRGR